MKRSTFIRLALGISRGEPTADVPAAARNRSLQLEIEHAIAKGLAFLQASEGSWVNSNSGRWSEKDPVLVTSYAVRTLEMMHAGV